MILELNSRFRLTYFGQLLSRLSVLGAERLDDAYSRSSRIRKPRNSFGGREEGASCTRRVQAGHRALREQHMGDRPVHGGALSEIGLLVSGTAAVKYADVIQTSRATQYMIGDHQSVLKQSWCLVLSCNTIVMAPVVRVISHFAASDFACF